MKGLTPSRFNLTGAAILQAFFDLKTHAKVAKAWGRGNMSGVFEKVVLLARRTAQPYSIQVRTIISFLVVSALLLGILLLVRAGISTNAPTTYTGTIKGTRVQVYSAPTSWSESFGDNLIDTHRQDKALFYITPAKGGMNKI